MRDQTNSQENSAAEVNSGAPYDVIAVKVLDNYMLELEFFDGLRGKAYLKDFIFAADAGVFEALRDETAFQQVFIDYGAVTWRCGLDLAPDAMHDDIEQYGAYRPQ